MSKFKKYILSTVIALIPVSYLSWNEFNTENCGLVFDSARYQLVNGIDEDTLLRLRSERSVSADAICEMPVGKLAKSLRRLDEPKPDHPGEAIKFRYSRQVSEDGKLNSKNWFAARDQVKQARAKYHKEFQRKGGGITSHDWVAMGPGNIGGRVRSLAFDPDNSQRIYIGAVAGGVWLSEDGGGSWKPTDDFMANLSVSTLVVDPNNSNVIYAGTGEGTFNADQVRGLGIFKSSDKGQTWSQLSATNDSFDFYWVNRLAILPNSSRIVAATFTGIWTSDDGGASWQSRYTGRVFDVDAHPTNNNLLIAGGEGVGLYSTDGGNSWQTATGIVGDTGRVEIAYAKGSPTTVYTSVNVNSGEVWKSTDGGQTYALVNTGNSPLGGQGWYDNALWVDPTNSEHLIVGGINLWQSNDGGTTFSEISTWWKAPNSAHADQHFIVEHPEYNGTTNKQVYFTNDGGVYTTPDVSVALDDVGWQELNNQLAITQFYGIGVAPDGTVVGGTQDNGTLVYKGDSEGWTTTFGGDGGYSAADPMDSNYLYGEYVYLQIHRSTNGGVGYSSDYIYTDAMTTGANFIAPFTLDQNNSNRLLAGAAELWVSDDVKAETPSWTSIKPAIASGNSISAIAVAPGDSNIIYVGYDGGYLYKTTNGTDPNPTWVDISGTLPSRSILRIAIAPDNSDVIYVAFSGYNSGNLWKSIDGGLTWSDSTGLTPSNIPPAPIRTIAIKPNDSNLVYVGTEVGIYASEDAGAFWSLDNDGPANVSVDELVWGDADTLYAATHGRGIFKISIAGLIFNTLTDVPLSSEQSSNTQTFKGLSGETSLSISNGEYSIGCDGNFSSAATTVTNGQTICVRHSTSADYWTMTTTTVTLGSRTFEFSSRTIPDTIPDEVTFNELLDVDLGAVQQSNAVTITGITNQAPISIDAGEYSIGCTGDNYTSANGIIDLNGSICLRHTASSEHLGVVTSTVTVGESNFEFSSTTVPDTTPDDFAFTAVDGVLVGSSQTSDSVTISGIQVAVSVSIVDGEYSVGCTSNFTSSDGEISPETSICVRQNASTEYLTSKTTTLTIGGVEGSFVSTTSNDITPDAFVFTSVNNAELSSMQTSNAVTITGIAIPVDISVSGGEYSIGCTATFSSVASTISAGQTVCIRHNASSAYLTSTTTSLTIGRSSSAFSSTTKAAPPPPSNSSGGGSSSLLMLLGSFSLLISRRKAK